MLNNNFPVGSDVLTAVFIKSSVFWDRLLVTCFRLVSSTLKVETTCSSETSALYPRR
jgi:hypothetical protein